MKQRGKEGGGMGYSDLEKLSLTMGSGRSIANLWILYPKNSATAPVILLEHNTSIHTMSDTVLTGHTIIIELVRIVQLYPRSAGVAT